MSMDQSRSLNQNVVSSRQQTNITPINHDEQYIRYLQQAFGTTSVPFFGAILCIVAIIVITFIAIFISMMSSPVLEGVQSDVPLPYKSPIIILD